MYTILGGSFTRFHKGHKVMLEAAAATGKHIIIGLTSDSYIKSHKHYPTRAYAARKRSIERFLSGLTRNFEILPLESRNGNTETDPDYSTIIVSPETASQAEIINRTRVSAGLKPMEIITIPMVLAEDLFPLSSRRISAGEIRSSGARISPVDVRISTNNQLKLSYVERFLRSLMKNFQVSMNTDYEIPGDQPLGSDTTSYAVKRAIQALGSGDYGIGIESGLYRDGTTGKILDVHYCAVVDRYSRITVGTSSGFEIPQKIVQNVKEGLTESQAFRKVYGVSDPGTTSGLVGIQSGERVTRSELITEAVRNAFMPRTSPSYYGLDRKGD